MESPLILENAGKLQFQHHIFNNYDSITICIGELFYIINAFHVWWQIFAIILISVKDLSIIDMKYQ